MEQKELFALFLLYDVCTLLMPCLGEVAGRPEVFRPSACNSQTNVCGDGTCQEPVDSDKGYICVCSEGYQFSKEMGKCEDLRPSTCYSQTNICGDGKCQESVDSERGYTCVCSEGFQYSKETGKCEDVSVEDLTMPTIHTSGCSYSLSTNYSYCNRFQLQCIGSGRIQILRSEYGKILSPSEGSIPTTSSDARGRASNTTHQLPQALRCPSGTLTPCNRSSSVTLYNSAHRYDLFKRCSWKSTCQPPSVGTNIYHLISYRCVPDQHSVSFCNHSSASGQLINVVFDRSSLGKQNGTADKDKIITQCICNISSISSFQVSAPDIRLVDANESCIPSARISGIGGAETTCSSKQMTIATKSIMAEKSLKLSFDVAPEFIWIIVQAEETNERLSVECHQPTNPESHETGSTKGTTTSTETTSPKTDSTTSTTSSTTSSSTSSTTTTTSTTTEGKTDTTTTKQTHSTITVNPSTAISNNPGQGQPKKGFQAENDDGVPLTAIIVPIVVILIAIVVVGIFVLRRRLRHHAREDDADGAKVSYQVPATNGQITIYESATSKRTDDNYLVLEQEHVYNTLNEEHDNSETIKAKDMSRDQNNEYQTPEPRNNNKSGINEENVYTPLNAETIDTADYIDPNETVTLQNMPPTQTNEYFTLEPNNAILSGKPVSGSEATNIDGLDNIHPNDTETLQSMPPTQTNEYFTLEPQSTISSGKPVSVSDTISIDNPDHSNTNATVTLQSMPITQTNEYFTLEPQHTISPETENNTAGHDYFVLQFQSLPLPVDKFEMERVDNPDPPAKDHNGEENHNYFIIEPNETKQN